MTAPERDELLSDAVRVLTRAFREWPSDWAEFVSLATAGAAANVGGVEAILSRRPGSWEADFCRQLLTGTVGYDGEILLEHRTDPVVVDLWAEEILGDLLPLDYYETARTVTDARRDAAWPAEVDLEDLTPQQRADLEAAEQLDQRIEDLETADADDYEDRLTAAVRRLAAERKIPVPVLIESHEGWRRYEERSTDTADLIGLQLLEAAIDQTPLPGATEPGEPPRPVLERLTEPGQ